MNKIFFEFKRVFCLLFVLLILIPHLTANTHASDFAEALPDIPGAKNVYFENLDSGQIIVNKAQEEKIAPASTAKIMTGLLAIEFFEGKTDTVITVESSMLSETRGTSMRLGSGDKLTALDLIYGTICGGYNDAALVLAHAVSGNSQNFVKLMNEKALQLGAKNTVYTNPMGWDDDDMSTTLSDTVLIAKAAQKNELYMEISSAVSHKVKFRNGKEDFTVHNRNSLISSYYVQGYTNKYVSGLISGVTDNGGYCVATNITIDQASYICVVMGAIETDGVIHSFEAVNLLTSYAKRNLGFVTVAEEKTAVCDIPVDFALVDSSKDKNNRTVKAVLDADVKAFLPLNVDLSSEITYKYCLYSDRFTAPIDAGERVGGLDIYYKGELVATAPLVIEKDVAVNEITLGLNKLKGFIFGRAALISVISFVIIFIAWFLLFDRKTRRKKTKKIEYKSF